MNSILNIPIGINTSNEVIYCDIKEAPHLLIGGTTGGGKSSFLHALICSLLMKTTPDELIFLTIDTKMVELTQYDGIPNLISPCIADAWEAIDALKALVNMMENRYNALRNYGIKNISELPDYEKLPYILVIVDEIADLMMLSKHYVEESIVRIAQKARAVGIHLILATQTPRREVITGILKANLPTRIAFSTCSELDSRIILGCNGSGKLIGNGDALYSDQGKSPIRFQAPYISGEEIGAIVDHLRSSNLVSI